MSVASSGITGGSANSSSICGTNKAALLIFSNSAPLAIPGKSKYRRLLANLNHPISRVQSWKPVDFITVVSLNRQFPKAVFPAPVRPVTYILIGLAKISLFLRKCSLYPSASKFSSVKIFRASRRSLKIL